MLAAAAVLMIAAAAYGDDDKPEYRHLLFVETGDSLIVSTEENNGFGKLFDMPAYEALFTAANIVVVIRIQITPRNSNTLVAEQVVTIRAANDRWEDHFDLRIDLPGSHREFRVKSQGDAVKALTRLDKIPVAKLAVIPIGQEFVLKMVIALNPVGEETLAEIRRWLTQGNGGGLDRGGALFGSFVSVFYNPKIPDADRVLRIYSQAFVRTPL